MKKLVIFDLDGTLLDSIADLAGSCNHALGTCGFPVHSVQDYRFFVGNGLSKLFERALPEGEKTAANIERVRGAFMPFYDAHCRDLTKPYEGIPELLEELQARGLALAVASNKYHTATCGLVSHYFPDVTFAAVSGSKEGVPPKPHPAIIHDILARTGIPEKSVLFVGDSDVDMLTAAGAGVEAVGVTWGFRPRSELELLRPAHIIDSPEELLELIR